MKKMNEYRLKNKKGEILYCTYPFVAICVGAEGVQPCTWVRWLKHVRVEKMGLLNAWKSKTFNKVRNSIKNGSYKYCLFSECPEIQGEKKFCFTLDELKQKHTLIADYIEGNVTEFEGLPCQINISYDTDCNLSCRSCCRKLLPKISEDVKDRYLRDIESMGSSLENLFISGMGDPFTTPHYKKWLLNFPTHRFPELKFIVFATHGLNLTEKMWKALPESLKRIKIQLQISIDGAKKETYEKNRKGASFEKLISNLKFISKLRRNNKISELIIYYVYQQNNYMEIPLAVDMVKKYAVDKIIFAKIDNWGTYTKKRYKKINVADIDHPENDALMKILENSKTLYPGNIDVDIITNSESKHATFKEDIYTDKFSDKNIIKNNDFSQGLKNWHLLNLSNTSGFEKMNSVINVKRGHLSILINNSMGNNKNAPWALTLTQTLNLEEDKYYELFFDAMSDKTIKGLFVHILSVDGENWKDHSHNWKQISLTATKKRFVTSFCFKNVLTSGAMLRFEFGGIDVAKSIIKIENITLMESRRKKHYSYEV